KQCEVAVLGAQSVGPASLADVCVSQRCREPHAIRLRREGALEKRARLTPLALSPRHGRENGEQARVVAMNRQGVLENDSSLVGPTGAERGLCKSRERFDVPFAS